MHRGVSCVTRRADNHELPLFKRCAFCDERWIIAVGGIRLCVKHKDLVDAIERDATPRLQEVARG
jgi:hypothetical protein